MTTAQDPMMMTRRARRHREERDYRIVFWIAFPFFLLFSALSRLDPRRIWAPSQGGKPRRSIFRDAWIEAHSSIPFAFM